MSKPRNHTVEGIGFIVVCVVIAALLYFGSTRTSASNDQSASSSNAEASIASGDPTGDIAPSNAVAKSAETQTASGADENPDAEGEGYPDDNASVCEGYWLGKESIIAVRSMNGNGWNIGLYTKERADGLEEEARFDPVPDTMGTVGNDRADISYANIAGVSLKCSADGTAHDEEGGDMVKTDEASFRQITTAWKRALR